MILKIVDFDVDIKCHMIFITAPFAGLTVPLGCGAADTILNRNADQPDNDHLYNENDISVCGTLISVTSLNSVTNNLSLI